MRVAFFIVVLLNVALFGYFYTQEHATAPTSTVKPQLHPEKVKLAVTAAAASANPAVPASACYEWADIASDKMSGIEEAAAKLNLGDRLTRVPTSTFSVHIPPAKSKKEAQKKLEELKALGVENGVLIETPGNRRWAIEFGTFDNEQDATVQLNQLKEKGVKSAKVMPLEAPGNRLFVTGVDTALAAELEKLKQTFDVGKLSPVDCPVP